jgi:hypothetical protein
MQPKERTTMNSKQHGNIALARAVAHFSATGYSIFLPVGDNGGAIDLIVSPDGTTLQRIQCKYTEYRHTSMKAKYPDRMIYQVNLRPIKTQAHRIDSSLITPYTADAFDWLYVSTPHGDFLIDWPALCKERGQPPGFLVLGQQFTPNRTAQP